MQYCDQYVRQDYDFKNPRFERGYTNQIPLTIKPYPMKRGTISNYDEYSTNSVPEDEVFFKNHRF
jgi:hypothetical protein